LLPVADAVLMLSFFGHASNLADVLPPQLFMQQGLQGAQQLIQPDASIAFFSCCFLRCKLRAARSARVNSGVRHASRNKSVRSQGAKLRG
jgi:hypothetical protein